MSIKSNALAYRNQAKNHLSIPLANDKYDSRIDMLIDVASMAIESFTKRKLTDQTIIEYHDGRASNRIQTNEWPIKGGLASGGTKPELFIDSTSIFASGSEVDDTRYFSDDRDTSIVLNRGYTFSKGYRNIKIVYDIGLGIVTQNDADGTGTNDIPSDLVYACLDLVAWYYHSTSSERIGVKRKGKSGESVEYEQLIPQHISLLIEAYTRHELPMGDVATLNV